MFEDTDWLSEITGAAKGAVTDVAKSFAGYAANTVSSTLTRIGPKPTGNLTAAELDAGQRAGQPMISPSSFGGAVNIGAASIPIPVLIIGVAAVGFLILKRR